MSARGHKHSGSVVQNQKAHLANAYNELGKELSSTKIRVVGNYTLGKVIGEGAYGKVRMGVHRLTSVRVAIKQIPKAMSASLTREIHHHRTLHHPHVTQMYEVIATENSIWIVAELCSGGELFDYLVEKGRIAEDEAKIIFGQLCLAVGYLHEKGIVHRDLKLENVLLDERCRVKLGDFGFTREFDKGSLMETFCGTTGYASPEMLQGRKYFGPEVDIWSLGIILYCLLTGTLPFDDDDEDIMRQKIIIGEFEDPEWLSAESRDLIKNILQQDPTKRLPIAQILTHAWFITPTPPVRADTVDSSHVSSTTDASDTNSESNRLFASDTDVYSSTPTTPDEPEFKLDDKGAGGKGPAIHRTPSELTIRKADLETLHTKLSAPATHPGTVPEEDDAELGSPSAPPRMLSSLSLSSKGPPPPPVTRTPARTKRRSVSSIQNSDRGASADPDADTGDETVEILTPDVSASAEAGPQQAGGAHAMNFASLLSSPAPVIFSTPLERELLNTLSGLGFDIAQIVHSVLSDACDAAGAVWWMLKRKAEKRAMEQQQQGSAAPVSASPAAVDGPGEYITEGDVLAAVRNKRGPRTVAVQTEPAYSHLVLEPRSTISGLPQLSFVPPTPTVSAGRPVTPPRPESMARPMLSPVPSTTGESSASRSHPGTPAGSVKDKDRLEGNGSAISTKGRKGRSGSVSIIQRATTALEAAGLVRKKSSEAFRDKEKEREDKPERKGSAGTVSEETRSSHGSGSHGPASASKLTKSPPLRPSKDIKEKEPSTPPPSEDLHHPQPAIGSPWAMLTHPHGQSRDSLSQSHHGHAPPTPANSPGVSSADVRASMSTTSFGNGEETVKASSGSHRHRANLLTAFRLWFNEDRKGKRKQGQGSAAADAGPSGSSTIGKSQKQTPYNRGPGLPQAYSTSVKRRTSASSGAGKFVSNSKGHRPRASASSRRSSSVNSRRSSIASVQMIVLDSPAPVPGRRSFGSHTPNSEREGYSSRPSSIRSFSMQRHRKSPSASSSGSVNMRTTSPIDKYHRRQGSGSSTRVVRHVQTTTTTTSGSRRPPHVRSNSGASSTHSPASSRPTSFYEHPQLQRSNSDVEGYRTSSPFKSNSRPNSRARKSSQDGYTTTTTSTTFIAQKRTGAFASPSFNGSVGRSSWKKSWGLEPPGWQSRTAHLPIEVLAISPIPENATTSIRDVFSSGGRAGLGLGAVGVGGAGDESDWVDEDDDIPAFAGGLGQMATSMGGSSSHHPSSVVETVTLSPAPRGHRPSKRTNRSGSGSSTSSVERGGGARQGSKAGHSPSVSSTPLPPETSLYESAGRRQLPPGRSGQAFRQPIQEEDEGEEE
ncbi:Pkinase-domain-containing protein [Mycena albidolilacea]|uniref:Pkinase-domain-containing protein n=1 Tax=Mycena albidolilacea TaxID=1033008 RepID=A0AAD6ZEE5_9AGAR|nr:Pkinase-domain-containing protein [Mycena albidolilacea]